jgi:hypothetical protein
MRSISGWQAVTLIGGAACLASLPSLVAGQTGLPGKPPIGASGVAVTAEIGMYFPVGALVLDSTVLMRGVGSLKVGARVTVPMNNRLALETGLGWSPGLIAQRDWKQTRDLQAGVVLASLRARLRLTTESEDGIELFVAPGFGLVHRYGAAWSGMTGTTDAALVLGGGLRFAQSRSRLSFSATIEDYLTRVQFTGPGGYRFSSRQHNEIVFALGANIALTGN